MEVLNKVAPQKTKFLRANHSKFVTKDVSKAIMLRTKLRNQFLKMKTLEARTKYNRQRNIYVSLVKKAKRNYYKYLDLKDINDNKYFWATVKPLFSNKIKPVETTLLDESWEIIRNQVKVANVFNKYFVNIVHSMGITSNLIFFSNTNTSDDPLEKITDKYENHASITCINKHMKNSELFLYISTCHKKSDQ